MKQKKNLSQTKEHFEMLIAKKQYENLSKPWYKKLEVWKVLIGSVLTFLSVAVLYHNGLFDFQTKALQAERNALLAQKEYLEYAKAKLSDEQISMQLASNKMNEEKNILKQEVAQLSYVKQMAFKSLDERDKLLATTIMRNSELEKQHHASTEKIKMYETLGFGNSVYSTTANTNVFGYQAKPYDYQSSALSLYANTSKYSGSPFSTSTFIDTNSLWKAIAYSEEQKRLNPFISSFNGTTNYLTLPSTTSYEPITIGKFGQSNTTVDLSKWWLKDVSITGTGGEKLVLPVKY